mgnify:CR=1 FL=1
MKTTATPATEFLARHGGDRDPSPRRDPRAADALVDFALAYARNPRDGAALSAPTADELQRWDRPEVKAFRGKVAPFLFVNAVIVLLAIFTGVDLPQLAEDDLLGLLANVLRRQVEQCGYESRFDVRNADLGRPR